MGLNHSDPPKKINKMTIITIIDLALCLHKLTRNHNRIPKLKKKNNKNVNFNTLLI